MGIYTFDQLFVTPNADPFGYNQNLETSGDAEWFLQNAVYKNTPPAWQAGAIAVDQETRMYTHLREGPGVFSFWWKVESEDDGYDRLYYTLYDDADEAVVGGGGFISGDQDWAYKEVTVPAGNHYIRFMYKKNDASPPGIKDTGWIDEIKFVRTV